MPRIGYQGPVDLLPELYLDKGEGINDADVLRVGVIGSHGGLLGGYRLTFEQLWACALLVGAGQASADTIQAATTG
jgi:hypothetical protein